MAGSRNRGFRARATGRADIAFPQATLQGSTIALPGWAWLLIVGLTLALVSIFEAFKTCAARRNHGEGTE